MTETLVTRSARLTESSRGDWTEPATFAAGTREILECWFADKPIREEYLIAHGGKLAGAGAHAYSEGSATAGHEEAARFKR